MPQDKKNQRPTAPHAERTERNFEKAKKMMQATPRKELAEAEALARTVIVNEAFEVTRTKITSAQNELKKAHENAFVIVDAPVASQVATNRFGLFGSAVSSIGSLASTCVSYLNPFRK